MDCIDDPGAGQPMTGNLLTTRVDCDADSACLQVRYDWRRGYAFEKILSRPGRPFDCPGKRLQAAHLSTLRKRLTFSREPVHAGEILACGRISQAGAHF
jgi:hypothetical protein